VGLLRDSRKFSGHVPIYRAHRAVIFAIARLSCLKTVEIIFWLESCI